MKNTSKNASKGIAAINIAGEIINNIRYSDDIVIMVREYKITPQRISTFTFGLNGIEGNFNNAV